MMFDALQMYYVHGRWYDPEVGRFISPDENGEYLYGSGDDAVNWAWILQQALNSRGKLFPAGSIQTIDEGVGKVFRRTYSTEIVNSRLSEDELFDLMVTNFDAFANSDNVIFSASPTAMGR
jgi:hypothetical protein